MSFCQSISDCRYEKSNDFDGREHHKKIIYSFIESEDSGIWSNKRNSFNIDSNMSVIIHKFVFKLISLNR